MSDDKPIWQELPELGKLTCSSSMCERDLHCFRKKRPPAYATYRNGKCADCGADLIDWERIDKRKLRDIDYTIHALEFELWRHLYWHIPIDSPALDAAQKKGLDQIKIDLLKRLFRLLKPPSKEIFRDGTQTPLNGNIIYYAQHATATCCRKCLEEWYGIDRNRPLTDDEISYISELILSYIKKRGPF